MSPVIAPLPTLRPALGQIRQPAALLALIDAVVWEHDALTPAQVMLAALAAFIGADSSAGRWLRAVNPGGPEALAEAPAAQWPERYAYDWIVHLDPDRMATVRAAISALISDVPFAGMPAWKADARLARIGAQGFAGYWGELQGDA